jgi:hypothetical protein
VHRKRVTKQPRHRVASGMMSIRERQEKTTLVIAWIGDCAADWPGQRLELNGINVTPGVSANASVTVGLSPQSTQRGTPFSGGFTFGSPTASPHSYGEATALTTLLHQRQTPVARPTPRRR